jgi:RNA polymerase sigma-70 factor (ECF subfamily)
MTDRELIDLFHSGTREKAFTLLVEKYQQKVYFHIRRMVKDHDDTDDVLQNTFIKVWKGLENFRNEAQFYTWLYRIATNETITFLNSKNKKATVAFDGSDRGDDEEGFAPSNYIKGESNPVDGDDIQARLFNLRYYDEMPYDQMSEVLDTSVGALKASYHHAAQKIEAFLTERD